MTFSDFSLLIVEDDRELRALLEADASARGFRASAVTSVAEANAALDRSVFEVAVVDLSLGAESGFDVVRRIKAMTPDTEIVVISGSNSLASAIQSYDLAAFAFVQKPFDIDQLFVTVGRALEHRQMNLDNRRLHDVIQRGKRAWERTFDAIGDAIAVVDGGGRVLRGNQALGELMQRDVTALTGTSCEDLGFGGGETTAAVSRALAGEHSQAQVTARTGDIYTLTTFPVSDGVDGAAAVLVAKNVTEEIRSARRLQQMSEELAQANARSMSALEQLKSTQAQLLQAEKLSAIGQLVAGVAHELNNPLTSIIGYAQLLEEDLTEVGEVRDVPALAQDLRRIAQESERAARIVRNLLAFARRQAAARQPQDVAELFSRVVSLRAYELRLNSVALETDFESRLPPVVGDSSQLQQALLNLVLNAEQAMRGRSTRRMRVGARLNDAASAVELFVSDSGHGIDPKNLSRIFDPFFTTRDVGEGTGLGLSICYGIVRDHGGQITVDSQTGVGTTFTLILPARIEDPEGAEEVLIAHPDQSERDFLTAALTAWGYRVVNVAGAADALARYQRGALLGALVDCRVIDVDAAAWRAANTATHVPLVLLSLASGETEAERVGRALARAMVAPPYELRMLRGAVRVLAREYV